MLCFIVAVIGYSIALAGISQPVPNTSYLPILRCVCFIFGAYSGDLLLLIIVPPFGWLILVLCVCMSLQLLYKTHQQILLCFQQIFQSINQSTSKVFNISYGLFWNSFQSQFQVASRASKSSSMPTANSSEKQVKEMGQNGFLPIFHKLSSKMSYIWNCLGKCPCFETRFSISFTCFSLELAVGIEENRVSNVKFDF